MARAIIKRGAQWGAVALVSLLLGGCTREAPPDLIVIVVDTLRADHLGCYGYGRPTSPNLDQFAADGILFENAFAQSSWTSPSIASLFTSLYPSAHGVTTFASALPAALPTMAEVLQRQGFKTSGLSANFVHIIKRKGFARGFDTFAELHRQATAEEEAEFARRVAADAQTVTTRAIEAAASARGSRLFLYVHYMDPHSTYSPPEPFRGRFVRPYDGPFTGGTEQLKRVVQGELQVNDADLRRLVDLYDAEIAFVDAEIGRLFRELRKLDRFDNAVVVVLSDHGEEFGDHGGVFHGVTLYDEMTRVPLLVRLPSGRRAGSRVEQVVPLVDLGPTLLQLVGLQDDRTTQGRSIVDLLETGKSATSAPRAFSELHPDSVVEEALRPKAHRSAIATREWAYLVGPNGSSELYARDVDPAQKANRAQLDRAVAASLGLELETFSESMSSWGTTQREQVPLSETDREHLRALGYVP
jgi:arylsulfatase A-like enzyme